MRKLGRLGLVLAVVLPTLGVLFLAAPAAQALAGCPSGYTLDVGSSVCISLDGTAVGTRTPVLNPEPVREPSSVLAAANGSGGTPGQNANLATANGLNPEGKIGLAGRLGQGAAIITAGIVGYQVGQQVASWACGLGIHVECNPNDTPPGYQANQDIATSSQTDPGFTSVNVLRHCGSGGCNSTYTVVLQAGADMSLTTDGGRFEVQLKTSAPLSSSDSFQFYPIYQFPDGSYFVPRDYSGSSPVWYAAGAVCGGYVYQGATDGVVDCNINPNNFPTVDSNNNPHGGRAVLAALALPSYGSVQSDGNGYLPYSPGDKGTEARYGSNPWSIYYPQGSVYRPAPTVPNPTRNYTTSKQCKATDGSISTVTSQASASFTETDATTPAFPDVTCPAGTVPVEADVNENGGPQPKKVYGIKVPAPITDWQQKYPQCTDGSCRLGLWKVNGTEHLNCFENDSGCEDWFTDPTKVDDYVCTYGPGAASTFTATQSVDIAECNVYAPTFKPKQREKGVVLGDPATGETPDPSDGTKPGTDGGTSTQPKPAPAGAGDTSCFPHGWGLLNPVEYVLQPVKCALSWAFIPNDTDLSDLETQVKGDLGGTGWGQWITALGGLVGKLAPGGTGCSGPEFDFDFGPVSIHGHPLDACTAPLSIAATFSRAIITVFVVVYGGMACLRALGAAFGFELAWGRAQPAAG